MMELEGVSKEVLYLALGKLLGSVSKVYFIIQWDILNKGCKASIFVLEGEAVISTVYYLHFRHHKIISREGGLIQGFGECVFKLSA